MPSAAELLRAVGLMADGPVRWGSAVRSPRSGVFLVELPGPLAQAPVDVSICGKWIERVPTLTLDGARPDGRVLARRLAAFWLPSQAVLYVGSSEKSLGGRVGALYATALGSRRPHSGGHWLKTLRGLEGARVWWADTDAVMEYEDALLGAFAAAVPPAEVSALHDPAVVLPFANLRSALGERKNHGIEGALLAAEEAPASAVARSVRPVAGGEATGAARTPARARTAASPRSPERGPARPRTKAQAPKAAPTYLSSTGLERLEAELAELQHVQRPAVVARIKAARELGDLRENADYEAARREQSFIEGRIQAIEAIMRTAEVVVEATTHEVIVGSIVTLDAAGDPIRYTIVGSSEANPAEGRISYVSPLGRALTGRRAGDEVVVRTPGGERHYRIVAVE